MKKTILIATSVLIIISFLIYFGFGIVKNNDLSDYSKRRTAYQSSSIIMPELSSISNYSEIFYEYRQARWFFEYPNTMLLAVTYDHNTYTAKKGELDKYQYLNHTVKYENSSCYRIPEYKFTINSFDFKVIDTNSAQNYNNYPSDFGMIATSEAKNTIVYLYFNERNLNIIGDDGYNVDSMKSFILDCYNYNW